MFDGKPKPVSTYGRNVTLAETGTQSNVSVETVLAMWLQPKYSVLLQHALL